MSGAIIVTDPIVDETISFTEEVGARSPGWFNAECKRCGTYTTGGEHVVEEWAYEHVREHLRPKSPSKFRISKITVGDPWFPWYLAYPEGYGSDGMHYGDFTTAVAEFIRAAERQCPTCLKGAVVDTDWGWQCRACGSHDVAAGCVKP